MEKNDYRQKVSLFQNLYSSQSISILLGKLERLVMHDNDVKEKTLLYLRIKEALGKAKADEDVKQKRMPAVSVTFNGTGRQAARILGFTGLALVDLDGVADVEGAMAKVKADRHTLMAYRTVSHIDDPRQCNIDYEQLYAQLHDDMRRGFQYWFDQRDQQRVERQNQAFRVESDEEQLIRTHLRLPKPGEKITLLNAAGISQLINGGIVGRGLSS